MIILSQHEVSYTGVEGNMIRNLVGNLDKPKDMACFLTLET
jgi:hypothetical protein